ncbi:MAG: hypothetical protein IJ037_12705 [Clostridia bacterium]|nr:hypothetical protein [Clostridia bacterium]MBQ8368399.1 hypothetical protein [Clostridia bacterium]
MPDSLTVNTLTFPNLICERAADYAYFTECLDVLEMKHDCVRVTGIGETMLGRTVYAVSLGNPHMPGVLYIGGVSARDTQSTPALVRFVSDYAEFLERGKRMYGVSMSYLSAARSITVIPMLNPDGISIARKTANPLHKIDIPPEEWTGNARNADLMTDFETAHREPETNAVTGFVQTMGNVSLCLTLHPSEKGISYNPAAQRSVPVGRLLSRMIGCDVRKSASGIAQWFAQSTGRPAFTCATYEDKATQPDDYIALYAAMREAMFSVPLLI